MGPLSPFLGAAFSLAGAWVRDRSGASSKTDFGANLGTNFGTVFGGPFLRVLRSIFASELGPLCSPLKP